MSMQDLKSALDLIADEGGGDFEGPKDGALIEKAEKTLGVSFPDTYKEFLKALGCGDINGFEVFGLIGDDFDSSGIPDAVWITKKERESGLPKGLVLIGSVGDGGYFALDTEDLGPDRECPVVIYQVDGSIEKGVASDFGEFIFSELSNTL